MVTASPGMSRRSLAVATAVVLLNRMCAATVAATRTYFATTPAELTGMAVCADAAPDATVTPGISMLRHAIGVRNIGLLPREGPLSGANHIAGYYVRSRITAWA